MKNKAGKPSDPFDKTLTKAERDAPTFLEWSDATLARGVRDLAIRLKDFMGANGMSGMAAAIVLEKVAKEANATELDITLDKKTKVMVRR